MTLSFLAALILGAVQIIPLCDLGAIHPCDSAQYVVIQPLPNGKKSIVPGGGIAKPVPRALWMSQKEMVEYEYQQNFLYRRQYHEKTGWEKLQQMDRESKEQLKEQHPELFYQRGLN